jgi:hypothetical protein
MKNTITTTVLLLALSAGANAQQSEDKTLYLPMAPVTLNGVFQQPQQQGREGLQLQPTLASLAHPCNYSDRLYPYRHCFAYWCGIDLMADGAGMALYGTYDMLGTPGKQQTNDGVSFAAGGAATCGLGYAVTKMALKYEENHPDKLYPAYHYHHYHTFHYHYLFRGNGNHHSGHHFGGFHHH